MTPVAAKSNDTAYDFRNATPEELQEAFRLLYPNIDPSYVKKDGMIQMVNEKAEGKTLADLKDEQAQREKRLLETVPDDILELSFPDGLQDVLDRVGTRTTVADKFGDDDPDKEPEFRAYRYVYHRLQRAKVTLAEALKMEKKARGTRTGGTYFKGISISVPDDLHDESRFPNYIAEPILAMVEEFPNSKVVVSGTKRLYVKVQIVDDNKSTAIFQCLIPDEFADANRNALGITVEDDE